MRIHVVAVLDVYPRQVQHGLHAVREERECVAMPLYALRSGGRGQG